MTPGATLFVGRAIGEEGSKLLPYDDATGRPVAAPVGKLSWGIGFNLMACGSPGLFAVMLAYLVAPIDSDLAAHLPWYIEAPAAAQSVLVDIAYNEGLAGLLKFHKMLDAMSRGDWKAAAVECSIAASNPRVDASRYAPLRKILEAIA